ncbi:hypothetical protein SRHO_G00213870 [Serrasalmus rhombeus]
MAPPKPTYRRAEELQKLNAVKELKDYAPTLSRIIAYWATAERKKATPQISAQAEELKALEEKSSSPGSSVETQEKAVVQLQAELELLKKENAALYARLSLARALELKALDEKSSWTGRVVEAQQTSRAEGLC